LFRSPKTQRTKIQVRAGSIEFQGSMEEQMNSRLRSQFRVFAVMLCVLITAASAQAAVDAYLKLEGVKQGKFKGMSATDDRIGVTNFTYQAPVADKATGAMAGRRMHGTITIVKEVDAASPQFASAAATGEVLKNLELDFVHSGPNGAQEVYKSLVITGATVATIHRIMGGEKPMESITFSFDSESIVAKDKMGGKSAMDDWLARN
jgi:type VI secretion system secreted protein Hcp